jgi:hypothetical protein
MCLPAPARAPGRRPAHRNPLSPCAAASCCAEQLEDGARPAFIFAVARQPGGRLLAAACADGAVRFWAVAPSGHLEWVGQVWALAWSGGVWVGCDKGA